MDRGDSRILVVGIPETCAHSSHECNVLELIKSVHDTPESLMTTLICFSTQLKRHHGAPNISLAPNLFFPTKSFLHNKTNCWSERLI